MAIAFKRKSCATCTYWSGARKINSFKNGVTCDKANEIGVCSNPKSSFKNKDTKADYGSCTKFEMWNALSKLGI